MMTLSGATLYGFDMMNWAMVISGKGPTEGHGEVKIMADECGAPVLGWGRVRSWGMGLRWVCVGDVRLPAQLVGESVEGPRSRGCSG